MKSPDTRAVLRHRPWITFDLDHTLIDSPYWHLHFLPWLEQESGRQSTDMDTLWHCFQREANRAWRAGRWVDAFDWPALAESLGLSRMPAVQQPNPTVIRSLVLPGVEKMLWTLRRYPIRLGLVTNGFSAFQEPFLRALGWDYVFDAIITPDRTGTAKPNPAIMAAVHPGLVHIGDRLSHDVLVATRSHRGSIHLATGLPETDYIDPLSPAMIAPDFSAANLQEVFALITRLLWT
ncbi:MAG: hypothetical protein C7B45_14650 [Sulfobacillus acidophilus]|uniref:HAD family hydrolase n=1 Tax=Sulfobacillus acidophilus TaxID=53633 RepID=A0A2T2WE48_9FIRM|nr:MAG: hypothetical protein C7B45_14650 [Sulfobacillus acidophilus]